VNLGDICILHSVYLESIVHIASVAVRRSPSSLFSLSSVLRAGCIPFLFCLRRRFGFVDRLLKTTSGMVMMTETSPSAGVPPDPVAAPDRPAMAATAAAAVVVVQLSLGVRARRRTPRGWPPSAVVVLIGADRQPVMVMVRALIMREARQGSRRADRAAPPCTRFSRRPDRSCSVGAAKLVSHVCASTCSAVGRCAGSGLKLFAVRCR
jgi:hypothetical protein